LNERIGVGAKSAKEAHNEAATRIKFSVPIALPTVDGNNTPVPANPRINPY
jgi:hypothetical protein